MQLEMLYYQDNYKYLKSLKSLAGIGHKSIQIISTINPLKQQPELCIRNDVESFVNCKNFISLPDHSNDLPSIPLGYGLHPFQSA